MAKTPTPESLSWTIFSLTVLGAIAFVAAVGFLVLM